MWPWLAAVLAAGLLVPHSPVLADDDDLPGHGRDFPRTLTLDEPDIDDEVSLPTVVRIG